MQRTPAVKVMILNYRPSGAVFESLADSPRVYFDIARVESTDGVARLMRRVGTSRVVFGTHGPFLIFESALIRTFESQLTASENSSLFEQNARRFLGQTA